MLGRFGLQRPSRAGPVARWTVMAAVGTGCFRVQSDTAVEPTHDPGLVIVANTAMGCVELLDNPTGEARGELCLADLLPETCGETLASGWANCQTFGTFVEETEEGQAVVVVYARENDDPDERIPGGIIRFPAHDPAALQWHAAALEFPEHPSLAETCVDYQMAPPPTDTGAGGTEGEDETRQCALQMPHEAVRTPDGSALVVADSLNHRLVWLVPGEGEEPATVERILDDETDGWGDARSPNSLSLVEHDGRSYLLVSYKGRLEDEGGFTNEGRIMLWDITDPEAVSHVWSFPEDGYLAAVHNPEVWDLEEGCLLTYAHSRGLDEHVDEGRNGSLGVAWMGWEDPPVYLGDLTLHPDSPHAPIGFVRDVKVVAGGDSLLVTDSACAGPGDPGCSYTPKIMEVDLVIPEDEGLSGAFSEDHEQQQFIRVPVERVLMKTEDLVYPYESDLLLEEDLGDALGSLLAVP